MKHFTKDINIAIRISKTFTELNQKARQAENTIGKLLQEIPTDIELINDEEYATLRQAEVILLKIFKKTGEWDAREAIENYFINHPEND